MTRYIDAHRERFGVQPICDALGWNVSTYYAHKKRPPANRVLRDAYLLGEIRRVHTANYVGERHRAGLRRPPHGERAGLRGGRRSCRVMMATTLPRGWALATARGA
jgi:hypothetical protein